MQDEIVNAEKEQEKFKKVQLHTELGHQIAEKQQKQVADKVERKQMVMTSGGPVMEAEDIESINKKFRLQQQLTKLNLSKQRDMEEMERSARKKIELA